MSIIAVPYGISSYQHGIPKQSTFIDNIRVPIYYNIKFNTISATQYVTDPCKIVIDSKFRDEIRDGIENSILSYINRYN